MVPPMDVVDAGRMAVVQDPTGAVLSLWQPKESAGAELYGETGSLCWVELQTRDTAAATRFYSGLFGWTTNTGSLPGGGEYIIRG